MKRSLMLCLLLGLLLCGCKITQREAAVTSGRPVLHWLAIGGDSATAAARISRAVTELVGDTLGCDVEFRFVARNNIEEYLNTMSLTNVFPDIITFQNGDSLQQTAARGVLLCLDQQLKDYPGLMQTMEQVNEREQVCVDGSIYGIPFCNTAPYYAAFTIRTELCRDVGIDPGTITDLDGLEELLLKIHEKYPEKYCVVPNYSLIATPYWCDTLSSNNTSISVGVLPFAEKMAGAPVLFTDAPDFYDWCSRMYRWNQLGLILADASFNSESRQAYLNSTQIVGSFTRCNARWRAERSINGSQDTYDIRLSDYRLDYSESNPCYGISAGSMLQEQALALLERLYTDSELLLLCTCGEEGADYILDESGNIRAVPNTESRHIIIPWCWPNNCMLSEMMNSSWDIDEPVIISPSAGYLTDNQVNSVEKRKCDLVIAKYYPGLQNGSLNPDTVIPILRQELIDAGAESVMQEIRSGLEARCAAP